MLSDLESVKDMGGIDVADDDHKLLEILKSIDKEVKRECGRDLETATYTEYYNGDGTETLLVDQFPITSITNLYDDTDREYGSDTEISSDDYIIENANAGIISLEAGVFIKGIKNIKIVYVAGYSEADIPRDLKDAVNKLVIAEYLEITGAIFAVASEEKVADKPGRLRKQAWAVIKKYKRIR